MDQIIRTCSLALLIGVTAVPAAAQASADFAGMRAYVQGRAALSDDRLEEAVHHFRDVLQRQPGNADLVRRTFGIAIAAGNQEVAASLANRMGKENGQAVEKRLFLLGEAVQARDWAAARRELEALKANSGLAFLAPMIEAWIALGSGSGDPIAQIDIAQTNALTMAYAREHRALLLGAMGRTEEALEAYRPLLGATGGRSVRLKLAAADMLLGAGHKDEALGLLDGDDPALRKARTLIEAGKPLLTGVVTAEQGLAELYVRLAADLGRERVQALGLAAARVSTFLAPGNSEGWLVTGDLLAAQNSLPPALEALEHVPESDPFTEIAFGGRVQLLLRMDRSEEAVQLAKQTAKGSSDAAIWLQLGDVLSQMERYHEAAAAYDRAIDLTPEDQRGWALYLQRGSAYERDGQWRKAEKDLRRAHALAPEQAVVLNYLGYSLLDRGKNLEEAEALIAKASELQPDSGPIADSLGWVYYRRGDYARAVTVLERAATNEPAEPTINEHLGDAYWQMGRRVDARFAWRAALVGAEDQSIRQRLQAKLDWGLEPVVAKR